jgi:hypothetical protein
MARPGFESGGFCATIRSALMAPSCASLQFRRQTVRFFSESCTRHTCTIAASDLQLFDIRDLPCPAVAVARVTRMEAVAPYPRRSRHASAPVHRATGSRNHAHHTNIRQRISTRRRSPSETTDGRHSDAHARTRIDATTSSVLRTSASPVPLLTASGSFSVATGEPPV